MSVLLLSLALITGGCSSDSGKSDPNQDSDTETSLIDTTTVDQAELAEVENDLASLDADLEVIDQAIADLETIAP